MWPVDRLRTCVPSIRTRPLGPRICLAGVCRIEDKLRRLTDLQGSQGYDFLPIHCRKARRRGVEIRRVRRRGSPGPEPGAGRGGHPPAPAPDTSRAATIDMSPPPAPVRAVGRLYTERRSTEIIATRLGRTMRIGYHAAQESERLDSSICDVDPPRRDALFQATGSAIDITYHQQGPSKAGHGGWTIRFLRPRTT